MKLELFSFIQETCDYYQNNMPAYQYAENQLKRAFNQIFAHSRDSVVAFRSRIKTESSLKEKLIRNEFYLHYESGEDAVSHLPDLIGITIQCRFIRNEAELYHQLFDIFTETSDGYSVCNAYSSIFLNLRMPQPQIQRNGFTIFRIDGYYLHNTMKINFELQIKSMVHSFWSEIEHEVVYKNPDFVMYDTFNRNMLGAIRDNLDVVDRQLEIMYQEISYESKRAQIGMDAEGFKTFVSRSVNELVNRKLKESIGFATDFKKCSSVIAQYIYICDFINGNNNRDKMIEYLELLSLLSEGEMDFTEEIFFDTPYISRDPFCMNLGKFFETKMNHDFRFHVFFVIIFSLRHGAVSSILDEFCRFMKSLLIPRSWYRERFAKMDPDTRKIVCRKLELIVSEALTDRGSIDILFEDNLYQCMVLFRDYVEHLERKYTGRDIIPDLNAIAGDLYHQLSITLD